MFELFTERARQVVVLAQEEAHSLKHKHIGTEHILLGLVRATEGLAAHVLENLDITIERVRAQVVRVAPPGEQATSGAIPFTSGTKKVLELALREARSLEHNFIATEHILLGVVSDRESLAARILLDFGADSETIRDDVIRMLSGPGSTSSTDAHDLHEMSDSELDNRLAALLYEERANTSSRRKIQGKIDTLRAERANRRRRRRESGP